DRSVAGRPGPSSMVSRHPGTVRSVLQVRCPVSCWSIVVSLRKQSALRGAASLLAVSAPIACPEAGLLDAYVFTYTPPSASYHLLSMARMPLGLLSHLISPHRKHDPLQRGIALWPVRPRSRDGHGRPP